MALVQLTPDTTAVPNSISHGAEMRVQARRWLRVGAHLAPIVSPSMLDRWLRDGLLSHDHHAKAGKRLIKGFGRHGRHLSTGADVDYWIARGANLGLVCGLGHFVCLDFDDPDFYAAWRAGAGRDLDTHIERTGRGYHLYVRTQSLWPTSLRGQLQVITDGVATIAPSVHASGQPYRVLETGRIAWLEPADVARLFPFLPPRHEARPLIQGKWGAPDADGQGETVIQKIRHLRPVSEQARHLGLDLIEQGDGTYRCRCVHPHHEDRDPSMWLDDRRGTWGCWAAHCPLHGRHHDVINLRAVGAGISVGQALRDLARELGLPLDRRRRTP